MTTQRQRPRRRQGPSAARFIDLRLIGLIGFVLGVALHAWVVYSVLDDTSASSAEDTNQQQQEQIVEITAPTVVVPSPTPSPLPDRTDCEEIRGTQYRSESERTFFLANCL